MKIQLTEHRSVEISACLTADENNPALLNQATFALLNGAGIRVFKKHRGKDIHPFLLQQKNPQTLSLQADYYIGLDWLIPGVRFIQVEPKLNKKLALAFNQASDAAEDTEAIPEATPEPQDTNPSPDTQYAEIDYLRVLLDIMSAGLPEQDTGKLLLIDWQAPRIPITQKEDRLTPFLVVQFLQLLKTIVRKGLKKSYYKIQENLANKIKGKILVGTHIKQNLLNNRFTQTYCDYQVFGEDNTENRFLKKVFRFAASYVANNKPVFTGNIAAVEQLINYCRPALEHIGNELNEAQLKQVRHNPFFKEYREAITIGSHILKKFAYNITQTTSREITTPPFWIDMPRLFELYCYIQLIKANPADKQYIHYQFSTYGNALDILISKPGFEMVIDAKYKLHYQTKDALHQDIRQVAGYARLNKVLDKLSKENKAFNKDKILPCLIIYPDTSNGTANLSISAIQQEQVELKAYHKVYKLGIVIPMILQNSPFNYY
jgi:5-methylcytosine-specific restriction enzyme subunit McrC